MFAFRRGEREITAETYTKSTTHWPPFDREDSFSWSDKYEWSAGSRNGSILHELFDHDSKCHRNGDAFSENNNQTRPKPDTVNANLITANFPRENVRTVVCRFSFQKGREKLRVYRLHRNSKCARCTRRAYNSKILLHCQERTEFDNKPLSLITLLKYFSVKEKKRKTSFTKCEPVKGARKRDVKGTRVSNNRTFEKFREPLNGESCIINFWLPFVLDHVHPSLVLLV